MTELRRKNLSFEEWSLKLADYSENSDFLFNPITFNKLKESSPKLTNLVKHHLIQLENNKISIPDDQQYSFWEKYVKQQHPIPTQTENDIKLKYYQKYDNAIKKQNELEDKGISFLTFRPILVTNPLFQKYNEIYENNKLKNNMKIKEKAFRIYLDHNAKKQKPDPEVVENKKLKKNIERLFDNCTSEEEVLKQEKLLINLIGSVSKLQINELIRD
jgi:hypothetical protein